MRTARLAAVLIVLRVLAAADQPATGNQLDVVVRDGSGHILRDLTLSDFQLQQDGKALPVKDVKFADGGQEHLITLLFGPMLKDVAPVVRSAAETLIAATRKSSARIAVYQVDQSLTLLQAFTADRNALKAAISVATGKRRPGGSATPTGNGTEDQAVEAAATAMNETGARPPLAALIGISREQAKLPGRKAILFFCDSLPVNAGDEMFQTVVSAANRAGVSIYGIDSAALGISDKEERLRSASVGTMMGLNGQQTLGERVNSSQLVGMIEKDPSKVAHDRSSPVLRSLAEQTGGFSMATIAALHDLKRIPEDLGSYYEVSYESPGRLDGAFHNTQVSVDRPKSHVQGRDGYFAVPMLADRVALPFEVPLLEALDHPAEVPAFFHESAALSFRGKGDRPVQFVTVGVPSGDLQFQDDTTAGLRRAHLTVLAIVRDQAGKIAADFGRDVPIQCSPGACAGVEDRYLAFSGEFHLPPGSYTLESVMRDETGGQISTRRSAFTVAQVTPRLTLSSLCLVREIVPTSEAELDGAALRLGDRAIVPAVNGMVRRGKDASAFVFYAVYPNKDTKTPLALRLEVVKDGQSVLSGPVTTRPESWGNPQILSVDLRSLAPGPYDVRLVANQGEQQVESSARMVVEGAASATESTAEAVVRTASPEELTPGPPTVDQQRLLEDARQLVAHYSSRLPNFICTQVTRTMIDYGGRGNWRMIGEISELLTFVDGKEHYSTLTDKTSQHQLELNPMRVTSAGEFGTHLKRIFDPQYQARFGFVRQERIRGRRVQVFTYSVDGPHSKYEIRFNEGHTHASVFTAYHGLVYVDYATGGVRKLTVETDPLPATHPVRAVAVTLEYDDTSVGGKLYLLPVSAQMDIQMSKHRIARNNMTFRSYQRFGTSNRVTFHQAGE